MGPSEIKHLLRRLVRRPGFTAAAVLTSALGIGATVAIFSVVYGVLIRPLPYPEADRLVGLWHDAPGMGIYKFNQGYGSYTLYRERAQTLEDVALYDVQSFSLAGAGEPERLVGSRVTASFFSVLDSAPILGRTFSAEEDRPGGPDVLLLSHGFWQRRFDSSATAIGAVVQIDGKPWEVIGVMPEGFAFPDEEIELWVPHPIAAEELSEVNFSFNAVARLRPGATAEQATAELSALLLELPTAYPGVLNIEMLEQSGMTAFANRLRDDQVGDVRRLLWVLLGGVGFLLLIACTNVANLLLVRSEGRQRELAVRAALGASRARLAGDLVAESVVLAALGGTLGIGLARLGLAALAGLDPGNLPRIAAIRIDAPVLLFAAAISLLAGLVFGILPSWRLRHRVFGMALAESGRGGSTGRSSQRMRSLLVIAQMALALVLLFGSALMLRTFQALREVDPGFDRQTILTLRLTLHGERYADAEQRARFWTHLADQARDLPGVEAVAAVYNLPLTDGDTNPGYIIEDFPPQAEDPPLVALQNFVTGDYFQTLGIPLLIGRGIERHDIEERTPSVVVSAAFARRIWGDTSVIGKRLKRGLPSDQRAPWYEVVGVAGDVRDDSLTSDPAEMVYFPLLAQPEDESGWTPSVMSLAVASSSGDPLSLAPALRQLVRRLDAELPIVRMRTTAEIARQSMVRTTFTMTLLLIASLVAIILGSIGIYGVLAQSVAQRTLEIGIRLALGADGGKVRSMLVGQGLRLAAIGIGVGWLGAVVVGRLLGALLFGVSTSDPSSFVAVALLLGLVAAIASLVPAQRAARLAPSEALRHQ